MELLHADICRPISPCTLADNKYFLLIVDDFTRWMWVFILATKNDAFRAFKNFKFLMENKTEYKIKTLRTDWGSEFLSTEFTQFCENEGIKRHLTAPYTLQQIGVVERCNRTMMVMTRSLLKGTHMPVRFWGEAVRHAVYLLNHLPTKALGECTPFEAWMGRKPHLAHLRVFGCVAYVKNTAPHLKKLDDRSSPMVYLAVEEVCKAHRLFDPRPGKLQVSRGVMFRENCEWTWNAGANNEEKVLEFMVVDAFGTDEVIVAADIEAVVEDVTTLAVAVVPMKGVPSPSTSSSNPHTTFSPSITNSPESYEGPLKMTDCNAIKHPMESKTQLHKDLEGTPVDTTEYRRIIGCLRYLLHTWPNLSYSVGMASRYMERPTIMHHKVVKQILRYLKGTIYFGLVYIKGPQEIGIFGYSDSDLVGDIDGRKNTSGMTFYFNESLVSWNSQKQKTVTLLSCEAEFMAAATAACHALWLRSLASELTGVEPKLVTLFVDNKSAIALMKNPVLHDRSKHIDTMFHFIRECIERGQIVVEFVNTGEQQADALTKTLPGVKLAAMRQLLDVRDLQPYQD
ncbi:hypothetical protein ZIOFF_070557 [Zingiber officinale]|uniref:Integrase catalytic domain-containing protein n=1 Tax=Zingiber officinale TaxID=94328 RepID=A0A8J5C8Q8_ZINOF|nr:hypothetical protein ZIOFF_070557 [Zingiber officinale]